MARKPTGRPPGRPRLGNATKNVTVAAPITEEGLAYIDRRRGAWTRAEYIRQALALAAKHNLKGPKA